MRAVALWQIHIERVKVSIAVLQCGNRHIAGRQAGERICSHIRLHNLPPARYLFHFPIGDSHPEYGLLRAT